MQMRFTLPARLLRAASLLAIAGAACLAGALPAAADGETPALSARAASTPATIAASTKSVAGDGEAALPSEPAKVTSAQDSAAEPPPGDAATQTRPRKPPKKRRGGINPCLTPDPGWGIYDPWSSAPSMGQMIAPHKGGITKRGSFDVIIHFHGHEPIRKEFVKTAKGIVLVGIDLGIGSGAYANAFASPTTFTHLLQSIETAMAKRTGNKNARIRKLALSAWSAGYGAIDQILRQPAGKKVDAVVLLDSVHASYADDRSKSLKANGLDTFVGFARRAAAKQAFMFMSHSSIIPPGYASTTETARYFVSQLKGKPRKAHRQDVLGLDMIARFDRGDFHVRGYTGEDKPDHCAHIGLMADVIRVHLQPRWKSPRGKR
jgi:hypothetical protein